MLNPTLTFSLYKFGAHTSYVVTYNYNMNQQQCFEYIETEIDKKLLSFLLFLVNISEWLSFNSTMLNK